MQLTKLENFIIELRGEKVILDYELAKLYETETKRLKQAVKRNIDRFPQDFMFEITQEEWKNLRSQFVTSSEHGGTRYMPLAFTEQGIAMLSSVLKSPKAIEVNIAIMRTFVNLRKFLTHHDALKNRINKLEKALDTKFKDIYQLLNYLLKKNPKPSQKSRRKIGFKNKMK